MTEQWPIIRWRRRLYATSDWHDCDAPDMSTLTRSHDIKHGEESRCTYYWNREYETSYAQSFRYERREIYPEDLVREAAEQCPDA